MNNVEEKRLIEKIKEHMKRHGMVSYDIGIVDSQIGKIRVTPKGWERLLVPIKGYYYDIFELFKVMHLKGELYFMVQEEHKTYDYPRKKEIYRFTWDELVNMVETKKWTVRNYGFGGKDNTTWRIWKLKSIESSLRYYDPKEDEAWRKQPRLSEENIKILVKISESETSIAEKLVDKIFGY